MLRKRRADTEAARVGARRPRCPRLGQPPPRAGQRAAAGRRYPCPRQRRRPCAAGSLNHGEERAPVRCAEAPRGGSQRRWPAQQPSRRQPWRRAARPSAGGTRGTSPRRVLPRRRRLRHDLGRRAGRYFDGAARRGV